MKYLFINSVCGIGSTGKICTDLAQKLESEGHEVKIAYGRKGMVPEPFKKYAVRIGTDFDCKVHMLQTRLFDTHGFGSKYATKKFLQWAEEYAPNVLWLHNIHGYYINVEMLFTWIKKHPEIEIKWTLHDCWAFTGHCAYFTAAKCEQWKEQCKCCPQLHRYPACYAISSVSRNFERKRTAFTGVKNMTLITPSKWLAGLVHQSFLRAYPIEVHYNEIDKKIFKPTPSNFRECYGLENKIIVLGVANVWEERKGLLDFYKLYQMLDDRYAIVLVGLSEKQIKAISKNIMGVRRIDGQQTKVLIYNTTGNALANPHIKKNGGATVQTQEYTKGNKQNCNANRIVTQNVGVLYEAVTGEKFTDLGKHTKKSECIITVMPRTGSPQELAAIYTAADIFVNPTYEDNYPTVNLEAIACGTTVITYDTGGCRETIENETEDE